MKVKSCLTNPTAFHIEMTGSVDERRAVDAVYFARLLTVSQLHPQDKMLKYRPDKWTVRWIEQ